MHAYLGKRPNYFVCPYRAVRKNRALREWCTIRVPRVRFRKAETELKLHGGLRPFSIAFAQVNKQEYKNAEIGFRSICNLECRKIAPRKLSIFACIVAILATMQA